MRRFMLVTAAVALFAWTPAPASADTVSCGGVAPAINQCNMWTGISPVPPSPSVEPGPGFVGVLVAEVLHESWTSDYDYRHTVSCDYRPARPPSCSGAIQGSWYPFQEYRLSGWVVLPSAGTWTVRSSY